MIPDLIERITPTWHLRAKCHPDEGHDPELWFPQATGGTRRHQATKAALDICAGCPVRRECRDDAIEHGADWGIWGGVDMEAKEVGDVA